MAAIVSINTGEVTVHLPEISSARRLGLVLVGSGAALVGYLSLGLTIWQIIPGAVPQIIYVETTALLILAGFTLYQASNITKLQREGLQMALQFADVQQIGDLAQGVFSLVVNLTEEPRIDLTHHFNCITEEFFIHGNDGSFNWTFDGACAAHRSNSIVLKVSGDSPSDVVAMDITVTDELHGGSALAFDVLTDKAYCKVIQAYFTHALGDGDPFRIRFSCRWNNTFPKSRRKDYVFSSWAYYAGCGIDRIVGRLVADSPIYNFKLAKFEDGSWTETAHQPREVDSSRTRTELEWNIASPAHVYLLSFEKSPT
jgi:hypothetical protein